MTKPYLKKDNYSTSYFKDEVHTIRHRVDGPAVEYSNGDKHWWLNGKRHREDGPAIEFYNGTKYWFFYGKRHREDGPAIEFFDGTKIWYLNDKEYSENEYEVLTKRKNLINFL